ncbi:hypothetical protein [Amphibacillus xylanus]|uniref:Uncharacterized protein n=1 Tax=Amphibacillus xylanus (strain ATCC 51415 / DSM 6626 / JCM 7361 / LMG 17667 / NBRC 15112 / Ep01) TaxID=698758 RepID=K0IZF6_AMPXN|nr:hypothetical protein [Amphibacillus xylanus]BAM46352.1 hypothetical protein AXY_02200 [Amphibacillus xylanus NBRC 15112]
MEATINLGDEKVRLKANAITAIHYKNQFKSDILKDTLSALGGIESIVKLQSLEGAEDYEKLQVLLDDIDTVLIYQFVWAWAKTFDRNTKPFFEWIANVDMPPVTELLLEDGFVDLLVGNVYRKK